MAHKKSPSHFFNSHARMILSECRPLAMIIVRHSTFLKDLPSSPEPEEDELQAAPPPPLSLPALLTATQINTALQGPYQTFLKILITAYAKIFRNRLDLHLSKEEVFKDKRAVLPEADMIHPAQLKKINFNDLDNLQKSLNELTQEYYEEWQNFYHEAAQTICEQLAKNNIQLTELEVKEMHDEEPMTELLPQFIERGLPLPTVAESMTFSDFFEIKIQIIIVNALSRQHLPHTAHELQPIIKNFKKEFHTIKKQEQELLAKQSQTVKEVIKGLV